MNPFFVHATTPNFSYRQSAAIRRMAKGATFFINPVPGNDRLVELRFTLCSNKDVFCKKTGREEVIRKHPVVINKRDVPTLIAEVVSGNVAMHHYVTPTDYYYLYKYML